MWKRGKTDSLWDQICSHLDLTLSDHGIFRIFWRSWGKLPGLMYRSNQPYPFQLKKDLTNLKIKSVINLRGERDCSSYYLESSFCKKNHIKLYNYPISSREIPSKEKILGFFHLLDNIKYPCVMHCKSGADRAGLAAALYLIYKNHSTVKEAKKQLTFKHLHIRYAKTGILDHFFEYALKNNINKHEDFIDWIKKGFNKKKVNGKFAYSNMLSFLLDRILKRE